MRDVLLTQTTVPVCVAGGSGDFALRMYDVTAIATAKRMGSAEGAPNAVSAFSGHRNVVHTIDDFGDAFTVSGAAYLCMQGSSLT